MYNVTFGLELWMVNQKPQINEEAHQQIANDHTPTF
jgi:hypothetical protein